MVAFETGVPEAYAVKVVSAFMSVLVFVKLLRL